MDITDAKYSSPGKEDAKMYSTDWQSLDEFWYSKIDIFSMKKKWTENPKMLHFNIVQAAPYGGPIAAVRNEKIFQPARGNIRPELQIFTAAGSLIGSTQWNYSGLVSMGWSPDEVLVCVFQDGVIRTFSSFCEKLHFFTIDERVKAEGGVIQAILWSEGIIVVSANLSIYANFSFSKKDCCKLADAGLRGPPLALCVLPESAKLNDENLLSENFEKNAHLLVATENGRVLKIDRHDCVDINIEDGPFVSLSVSRSGSLLACLSSKGIFKVYSTSNLSSTVDIANIECRKRPRQMVWCGDDCIALYMSIPTPSGDSQHILFAGGPKNDWLLYQYSHPIHLVSEVDGVRIITPFKAELLRRVPHSTEIIFNIGSCEAPAMLCYALERYNLGDVAAAESLRTIQNDLGEASAACIEAATHEWHAEDATRLLRAAVFGRHFMNLNTPCNALVEACRNIRICFAVRSSPLEIPLTVLQLRHLGIKTLVENLSRRRQHLLACRICEYVGLSPSRVLIDWATEKITHTLHLTDKQLCAVIRNKFQLCPGISYSEVANVAAKVTRPNLATMLLEFEPRGENQVRMLLKLAEVNFAVEKAVAAGDPDLIYQCISTLLAQDDKAADGQRSMTVLMEALDGKPLAADLFAVYCARTGEWELLQQYYERCGQLNQAGWVAASIANQKQDLEQKKTWLAFAAGFLGSHKGPGESLARFAHSAALEQIELLNMQRELEVKANTKGWPGAPHRFQGLSLMQTVRHIILKGEFLEADSLQKHFKIPDKRYWHFKIEALADGGYYDELLAFAQYRTSPVGYEPFVAACVRTQARNVAVKLTPRIKEPEIQAKWYTKLGLTREAQAAAMQPPTSTGIGGGLIQTIAGAFIGRR